ncbi:hypothetical protein ACLQ9F_11995 [Bordetella avium]|uniref:hypothetical protein n=1 Tax=Bordetella avium TaxID=521 RepID=UPI000FDA5E03|nr:hypothetical protein [Bordetella avium]AZY48844.1 hypothetical protein C0J09_06600 [Bordetella avium]AZY52224.1 hypothetical protein C0J07_06670 [Bordetella avium]
MSDLLDWVEKAALENLRAHHQAADVIAKEATTTLTVLLAGMAGALAYAAKGVDAAAWTWLSVGAAAFSAYLLLLGLWLVLGCMKIGDLPAIHNEPGNLFQPGIPLEDLRKYELENMQLRINDAAARNSRVARALNNIRLAAILSPVVLIVTGLVWEWVQA